MKKLILILALMLTLQADKILLSGISFHAEKYNLDGKEVNSLNYGIGYQKEYNYDGFNTTATSLILKDSFSNPMVSVTYGIRKGVDYKGYNVSLGAEFGIAYKKILYGKIGQLETTSHYKYTLLPIAFVPTLSIMKNGVSIDILHLPEINHELIHVMSVTLVMIGIKI